MMKVEPFFIQELLQTIVYDRSTHKT